MALPITRIRNISLRKFNFAAVTTFMLSSLLVIFGGCANYQFTFNDKVIYEPPKLLSDIQVADNHLARCIAQTAQDQELTAVEQLKTLSCSHAGIQSVAGIEQFTGLKQLNLDNNQIADIKPLSSLARLELLYLAQNPLRDITPLFDLKNLRTLRLSGIKELECKPLSYLKDQIKQGLEVPEHCQSSTSKPLK